MMSILFYLSRHVNTPLPHKDARPVTVTRKQDAKEYGRDTTAVQSLFHIGQSEDQPDWAFLAIPYRGGWLYLADKDFASKLTFVFDAFFSPAILRRADIDCTSALMPLLFPFYICAA